MKTRTIFTVCGALLMLTTAVDAQKKPTEPLKSFSTVEVVNFENPAAGLEEHMPDEWLRLIREDVTQKLMEKHLFRHVQGIADEKAKGPDKERTLLVSGKIVEFTTGSQAKRIIAGGYGVGNGVLAAHVTLTDKESGKLIWEGRVEGKVKGSAFDKAIELQDMQRAIRGLSKELVGKIASLYN